MGPTIIVLCVKTRKSDSLQMALERQHFIFSHFKTPSVDPVEVWATASHSPEGVCLID